MTTGAAMRGADSGGFTLIELLVVVALIMVMYVMAYGPAQKSYQDKQLTVCQKNLQMIHVALKIYAADFHDSFPIVCGALTAEAPLSLLVPRYTSETSIFICPGSPDRRLPEARPFGNRKISYAYYMGRAAGDGPDAVSVSDEQVDARPRLAGERLFSTDGKRPGNNHRRFGGNLLFCDGHVESSESHAVRALPLSAGVVLLNPTP